MSEILVTTVKHESATTDNITLGSNGSVGIGTSSPTDKLHVSGESFPNIKIETNSASSGDSTLDLVGYRTTNSPVGYLKFWNNATSQTELARVTSYREGENNTGNLRFYTSSAGSLGERMRIDSAGRVTMPYQPSFFADVSSATTFQGDVSNAVGIFNRATVNIGNHYSTATGKFTAPVAGTYVFSIGAACSTNIQQFWFVVNGNRSESFLVAAAGAQNSILSASGMMRLQAGDSLGVLPYTGTANVTLSPSSLHTFFRGHLIG